jgi:hypothetical protein
MPATSFPFWIILPDSPGNDGRSQGHVFTFSSTDRAMAYMQQHSEEKWQVKLVSRISRSEVEKLLKDRAVHTVFHDQNPDGGGGKVATVEELFAHWKLSTAP